MTEPLPVTRRVAPATIALILAALLAVVAITVAITRDSGDSVTVNAAVPAGPPGGTLDQAITSLRQQVAAEPDNAGAWFLLGRAHRDSEQLPQAEQAFRRAMELAPGNALHVAYLAESVLLLRPGDEGRAEARQLFQRATQIDPREPMVRFYLATMKDQDGQHRQAVDELIALLNEAPPGALWEPQVRNAVEGIARQNNIDIAARLPAARPSSPATAAIPGPSREQMEAAKAMPPGQQDQMVKAMVDRLAARLQQNPRDADGWIRLMRSRMVLGERDSAAAALRSGLAAFSNDAPSQQRLRTAAGELGVPVA